MTRDEHLQEALAHMERAQWTPERWAVTIEHGYKDERYAYEKTENFKAQQALWDAVHAASAPPAIDLAPVRSVLILAEDPYDALQAPSHYQFWVTADPYYRRYYSDGRFISAARGQGRTIRSWCDCKADVTTFGVGTSPADAIAMARDYGLDGWAGEGESAEAFQRGYDAGARVFVVNMGALSGDLNEGQLSKVASGEVVVTAELYRNDQPGLQPNWRNANAGIGSHCIAVYGLGAGEYADYSDVWARGLSFYCGGTPKPHYPTLP